MSNINISVVIPFSQNFSTTTSLSADTSGKSSTHIIPWNFVGSTTQAWLYGYDKQNGSNSWMINLLNGTIQNSDDSLKYLKKTNENLDLTSFFCDNIKVTLHHELNYYYSLESLRITTNTNTQRYTFEECDGNSYYFKINTNLNIDSADIEDAFTFTLKYRENLESVYVDKIIRHDPRATEIIKLTLNGYNLTYNVFDIAASGKIDLRQYRKRLYLRDTTEHGYLRYNAIKEKYSYKLSASLYTMFEFEIIDSSLYNVTIKGAGTNNNILVPELKVKSGTFVCSVLNTELTSGNEASLKVEYCELILYESEAEKVPYGSTILRITKS